MYTGTCAVIEDYLQKPGVRKLHLGCGRNILPGWLNSDLEPGSSNIARIDMTERLPFEDACFDYMFSEHVIEHLSYEQGLGMLCECHRVLRPGGRIRIATPDLAFLVDLYAAEKSDLQLRYIDWATVGYVSKAPVRADTFVINNFVRNWGHTFIYDEKVLRVSLYLAGFRAMTRCALNDSSDENLCNLENEERLPPGFLRLETFTLEGSKVQASSSAAAGRHG